MNRHSEHEQMYILYIYISIYTLHILRFITKAICIIILVVQKITIEMEEEGREKEKKMEMWLENRKTIVDFIVILYAHLQNQDNGENNKRTHQIANLMGILLFGLKCC